MVSETEEVCALNVTGVFMVSSTEMWDASWTVITCVTAQVPASNTWQTTRCNECTRKSAHIYASTWGRIPLFGCEVRQCLSRWQNNEYLHQLKIPWCCWTYQAGPALISQLAILEPLISFHPDHSVADRGHLEFKGYGPNCPLVLIISKLIKVSNKRDLRGILGSKWWLLNSYAKVFWIKLSLNESHAS